jgi:hypothetical protein
MAKKKVTPDDLLTAATALNSATALIADAKTKMPAAGSELTEEAHGAFDKLHKAKGQVLGALIDLGGRPCGGGRPC